MQRQQQPNVYNFKVVLLGEGCVGKTSLVMRYVDDRFNPNHITTLQASFLSKKLNICGKRVSLSIWDTAGQERFHALGPIYYRSSNGALLVYDVTDEDSFRKVKNWVKELKRQLGTDIVLTIVGNKIDLVDETSSSSSSSQQPTTSHVTVAEAETYARNVGARHFTTSAKENVGVEELFYELASMMIERSDAKAQQNANNAAPDAAVAGQRSSLRRLNASVLRVEGADDGAVVLDDGATTTATNRSRCCGGTVPATGAAGDGGEGRYGENG